MEQWSFAAERRYIELYARTMEERGVSRATIGRRLSTVAGFHRFAVIDVAIEHSPRSTSRRPKIDTERAALGSTAWSSAPSCTQGSAGSVVDQPLVCLRGSAAG